MKKVIIAIVAVVMFTACGNNNVETNPIKIDTVGIDTTSVKDTIVVVSEGNGDVITNVK